ncbi:Histone acetyltransferase [Massospora cicadina]|nr:Histone acetyltransferase [Massospora cicadina]
MCSRPGEPECENEQRVAEVLSVRTIISLNQPDDEDRKDAEPPRTSGSMTQNIHEISRVKNLNRIRMGRHEIEPWYFSPYPPEFADSPLIYICEFCLCAYHKEICFRRHRTKCKLRHPPGKEIYRSNDFSFSNHKTLYYDMDPFLFYVLTQNDEYGCHILGYFSKEKESLENYNLACILTLPQYQRKGYGRLLIQFSYELSKLEKKNGSPEKPLSDLGLMSYRAYWSEAIVEYLLNLYRMDNRSTVSIDQIASATAITPNDIVHTLNTIGALKYYRNEFVIHLSDAIIEGYLRATKKHSHTIDSACIQWTPYVTSSNQPRYLN